MTAQFDAQRAIQQGSSMVYRLLYAAGKAAEMLADGDIAAEMGTGFNCGEVTTLAEFLRAFGFDDAADYWIEDHAEGDDCGDEHCRCDSCKVVE